MKRSLLSATLSAALSASAVDFGSVDPTFQGPLVAPGEWCDWTLASTGDATVYAGVWSGGTHGLVRMFKDGTVDSQWGNNGRIVMPPHPDFGGVTITARGLLPMPDGGVIAIDDRLVKLTASGQLDTQYGTGGMSDAIQLGGFIESVALQPNGGVVVLSRGFNGGPNERFTRIAANGRLDSSFGKQGVIELATIGATIYAWSVQDGEVELGLYDVDPGSPPSLRLRRITASGDSLVNAGGRIVPGPGLARWTSPNVQVLPDGRVVLAEGQKVFRYTAAGILDAAFANGGVATLPPLDPPPPFNPWFASRLLSVGESGALTAILHIEYTSGGFFPAVRYFADHAYRLHPDGQLDPAFPQGKVVGVGQRTRYLQIDDGRLVGMQGDGPTCPERLTSDRLRMNVAIAEYYNPTLGRYFITAEGMETGILDADQGADRWTRTGWKFGGWLAFELPGAKRVCRFYLDTAGAGPGGHFYTLEGEECDFLRGLDAQTPARKRAWRFEGFAFSATQPTNGLCPANLTPIYRAYNRGFEQGGVPNHRFTSDLTTYRAMLSQGWAGEGVRFCMPPISDPVSR